MGWKMCFSVWIRELPWRSCRKDEKKYRTIRKFFSILPMPDAMNSGLHEASEGPVSVVDEGGTLKRTHYGSDGFPWTYDSADSPPFAPSRTDSCEKPALAAQQTIVPIE
jgi:hypothetical protein